VTVGQCFQWAKTAGFTQVHAIAVAGDWVSNNGYECLWRSSSSLRLDTGSVLGNAELCNDSEPDQSPEPGATVGCGTNCGSSSVFDLTYDATAGVSAASVECGAGGSNTLTWTIAPGLTSPRVCDYGTFAAASPPAGFAADVVTWPAASTGASTPDAPYLQQLDTDVKAGTVTLDGDTQGVASAVTALESAAVGSHTTLASLMGELETVDSDVRSVTAAVDGLSGVGGGGGGSTGGVVELSSGDRQMEADATGQIDGDLWVIVGVLLAVFVGRELLRWIWP
jgi:hypothetical protein